MTPRIKMSTNFSFIKKKELLRDKHACGWTQMFTAYPVQEVFVF